MAKNVVVTAAFSAALDNWLKGAQAIVAEHYATNLANLSVPVLTIEDGRRYIRIFSNESSWRDVVYNSGREGRRIHAFIDKGFIPFGCFGYEGVKGNGDILMPASWKAPAAHARGNLFDSSGGVSCMTPHGVKYLK